MRKIEKILTVGVCVLAVLLLVVYGFRGFDNQEVSGMQQAEKEKENTDQEKSEIESSAEPTEQGVKITYDEDFTMPSDDSIQNLFVYQCHDMFEQNEYEKQKKYAEELSQKLLKNFFPGEKWNRNVVSDAYQDNYVYRIQGKEENGFQYTANKEGIDNTQLLCEPGEITVPIPEDGDYDKAYQDFSMKMLQDFQVGLWDGENVHMALTDTKDVTETGGYYRYMLSFDGINVTKSLGLSFSEQAMMWAAFHYEDGSLLGMFQMAQRVLDGKRECKPKYASVEEAVDVLKQAIEIYYKQRAKNFEDYYADYAVNVKNVSLEYTSYMGRDGLVYVPILNASIQEDMYDVSEKTWESKETCYAIQLETGETGDGTYQDNVWGWQAPMTDRE